MRWWRRKPEINKIVLTMVYADFLLISGKGFLSPIIAVFIADQINGGSVAAVGFATMIFWVVKSAFQVPVSTYADSKRGEDDDYRLMLLGATASSVVPLLYYFFATEVWHVYVLQAMDGVAHAFFVPQWLAIFTRHIDKHRESSEWTLHSNAIGLGFASAAAIGGVLAERFGFRVVFLLVSAFMFLGTVVLLGIKERIDGDDGGETAAQEVATAHERSLRH
jgi:MFS family permease